MNSLFFVLRNSKYIKANFSAFLRFFFKTETCKIFLLCMCMYANNFLHKALKEKKDFMVNGAY